MIFLPLPFKIFVYRFAGPDKQLITGIQETMFDMAEEMSDLSKKRMPGKSSYIFFLSAIGTKPMLYFRLTIETGNRHKI